MNEQFMALIEPHCHGFDELKTQTVRQWIDNQGITIYNEINDKLMHIISLKNRMMPGPLDIKTRHLFYTTLYDLDNFRSQFTKSATQNRFKVDALTIERAMDDDVALLELGMRWIEEVLFGVA